MPFFCGLRGTLPKVGQTPLITAANALIEVLDEVDQYPALYLNHRVLRNAIFRYEHRWIPLLASVPSTMRLYLVPPLDVEWVWFVHMLCPVKYIADSAAMWNAVRPTDVPSVIDHKLLPGPERQEAKRRAALLWGEMFPDESFDILQSLKGAPIHEDLITWECKPKKRKPAPKSNISYDIVAAAERQMTFHYQVAIMPHYKEKAFLRHSVKRYNNMFLKLIKRFPDEIWVPTYDVDIIWHAHMMHPRWYKETTEKLVGSVLPHDDTLNERSTGSQFDVRWDATVKKWTKLFREPIIRDGGMWRGNIEACERMERPRLKKLLQIVEDRALSTLEKFSGSYRKSGAKGIRFSVVYGGDVNWDELHVDWVHMTDWRRSNRAGRSPADKMDNKIERLTFLKHADLPRLLTCRTRHFLMYNNRNAPCSFGTIVEVFGVGTSLNVPLATAHYVLPHNLRNQEDLFSSNSCARRFNDSVMLLRVGGEDFGLLFGRWTGFIAPRKATEDDEGQRGSPGQLELRMWLLGINATEEWLNIRRTGNSKEPGQYSFELPLVEDGRIASFSPVEFDISNAMVFTGHARHVVSAYVISMATAALYITLQPRFSPKGWRYMRTKTTIYPECSVPQNPYGMLRGAGGEVKGKVGNCGLWNMLLPILQSSKHVSRDGRTLPFSGSVEDIRTQPGAMVGGYDGAGGGHKKADNIFGESSGLAVLGLADLSNILKQVV